MHIGTKPRGVHLRLCSEDGDARKHVLNATPEAPRVNGCRSFDYCLHR